MTGALWEAMGYLEVALRNTLASRLARRHRRLGRPGNWLDDPAGELDVQARDDIGAARRRVQRNRKPLTFDQVISELGFGFWRYLLARRYATTLWPDLAGGFPHSPDRNRATIDAPVRKLHLLRNRLAHHQRIWTEPLTSQWAHIATILGYINTDYATWATGSSRVPRLLTGCPVPLPRT